MGGELPELLIDELVKVAFALAAFLRLQHLGNCLPFLGIGQGDTLAQADIFHSAFIVDRPFRRLPKARKLQIFFSKRGRLHLLLFDMDLGSETLLFGGQRSFLLIELLIDLVELQDEVRRIVVLRLGQQRLEGAIGVVLQVPENIGLLGEMRLP